MPPALPPLNITIAGGGIGGLAAALALHQRLAPRVHIRIFEQASATATRSQLGVGINIQPSGVLALYKLGLAHQLESVAIKTRSLNYYTGETAGVEIISDPRGMHAGYAVPQYSIHRGDLHHLLLAATIDRLGEDSVVFGSRVVGARTLANDPHHFSAIASVRDHTDTTEREIPCDVVIGADGIHSALRQQYYPNEGPAKYSGLMLWRATTVMPPYLGGDTMLMAGTNAAKLVAYPICRRTSDESRGELSLVNWIAEGWRRDLDDDDVHNNFVYNQRGDKEEFRHLFKDWGGEAFGADGFLDIQKLIDDAEEVYAFPMIDRVRVMCDEMRHEMCDEMRCVMRCVVDIT